MLFLTRACISGYQDYFAILYATFVAEYPTIKVGKGANSRPAPPTFNDIFAYQSDRYKYIFIDICGQIADKTASYAEL